MGGQSAAVVGGMAFCYFMALRGERMTDHQTTWRRRVAMVIRRYPWAARVIQQLYRLTQPRFTMGVIGVLLDDAGERVLLVEHVLHPKTPWGLPGGWMARGEDPAQTVEREFLEETGLSVKAIRPLVIQRSPEMRGHLDMVFLCEPDGPLVAIRLSNELLSYQWTPFEALPRLISIHDQAVRAAMDGELKTNH